MIILSLNFSFLFINFPLLSTNPSSWLSVILPNQILFFSGVALTIGLKSSLQFFMKRSNYKVYLVLFLNLLSFNSQKKKKGLLSFMCSSLSASHPLFPLVFCRDRYFAYISLVFLLLILFILFLFPCFTGNSFIWCWIFLSCNWLAYTRNDSRGLWIHCTLQVCWIHVPLNIILSFIIPFVADELFCTVVSGQHYQYSCKRYLF